MRYIDSGTREPEQALAHWFEDLTAVEQLRLQTGFFRADALASVEGILLALRERQLPATLLIGANERTTLARDISRALDVVGVPRPNARFGVVAFDGAFFHPKVFHVRRADGSQAAYVGSANLTASGVTALHIEAGILLDTAMGDPASILSDIASAIDVWFEQGRSGLIEITAADTVEKLVQEGILARVAPPRPSRTAEADGNSSSLRRRPRLRPLFDLAPLASEAVSGEEEPEFDDEPPAASPSAPRPGFPDYLLFEPRTEMPTRGAQALTGVALPGGASGLIMKLSRDSSRHFFGGSGTSNMTLPVATTSTIRFGIYSGKFHRPRAEFALDIRLIGDSATVAIPRTATNVMAYGMASGETGHRDIRMVVPAQVRVLGQEGSRLGMTLPGPDDYALLQWPKQADPVFRLSFLEPGSAVAVKAAAAYESADQNGELIGRGACALPPALSLPWTE